MYCHCDLRSSQGLDRVPSPVRSALSPIMGTPSAAAAEIEKPSRVNIITLGFVAWQIRTDGGSGGGPAGGGEDAAAGGSPVECAR
jgi:hypothetical protein